MTAKRRFLLALWDGGGVVPPLMGVARRLVARGHSVHVLCDPTVEAEARAAGCSFAPWRSAPHRTSRHRSADILRDYEHKNLFKSLESSMKAFFRDPGPRWVADTLDELAAHPVDVVLADFLLPWVVVAAEKRGLPSALLSPNILMLPTPGVPPVGMGLLPAGGLLGRVRDAMMRGMTERMWNRVLPTLNAVRREHGLEPLRRYTDQVRRADRILVLTSLAFDYTSPQMPSNVHWVGAQLDDPEWSEPWTSPWPADDVRPLVLVGLSSTFQDQIETLRRIVAALAALPVRAVLTLGPTVGVDEVLGAENVVVVRSAPHGPLLRQAAALVTHCGHGTTLKGLAAGVPMVCVPMGRDQHDNAARVVHRGAGVRVRASASVEALRAAITEVLTEPRYREAAGAAAAAIRARAGEHDVVELLEALAITPAATGASPAAVAAG